MATGQCRPESISCREVSRVAPHAILHRASAFLHDELVRAREPAQPPLGEEALVDGAQPALESREHRRAEGDRLAVHRAARRHHEVRVPDEALRVDRALGHDEAARLP